MKHSKNQKRMEKLGACAEILRTVMIEVRDKELTRVELCGVESELRGVESQVKILRDALVMIEYRMHYRGVFVQTTSTPMSNPCREVLDERSANTATERL